MTVPSRLHLRHLGIISIIVAFGLRLGFPDFAVATNVSNVTQHLQSFFVGWLLGYRLMTGKTQGGCLANVDFDERVRCACMVPY